MHAPVAIQLTARAPGAIAVISVSGSGTASVLQKLARSPRVAHLSIGNLARTELLSATGEILDDALVARTGDERYELHLHGGTAVVDAVLQTLQSAGAKVLAAEAAAEHLGPGIDGELQLALPLAVTETALRLLLAQRRAWSAWTHLWRQNLASNLPLWQLHSAAQWLLHRSSTLSRLLHPARIAIIGPPNAGKSTLANALLGRPLAITSDLAGTTRDWVDAHAIFSTPSPAGPIHVPIVLVDTAGVRDAPDALEREAIARTHGQAAAADLLLLLFDGTRSPTPADLDLLSAFPDRPLIVAVNKSDAFPLPLPAPFLQRSALPISAKTHAGLEPLMSAALTQLDLHTLAPDECFAFSPPREQLLHELSLCTDRPACLHLLERLA